MMGSSFLCDGGRGWHGGGGGFGVVVIEFGLMVMRFGLIAVSYTHLRAHETDS